MSCECNRIGGRFIVEDPDCPAHGIEAQREQKEREAEKLAQEDKYRVLERQLNIVTQMVLTQNERLTAMERKFLELKRSL